MNFLSLKKMLFLLFNIFIFIGLQAEGFIPGNLIKTKNGPKRIGSINVGDEIFCFNACKNEFTIEKVTHKKLTYTNEVVKITLSRNDQKSFVCSEEYLPIYSSSKQRFLSPLRINSSPQYWVLAENLKPGEYLLKYAE